MFRTNRTYLADLYPERLDVETVVRAETHIMTVKSESYQAEAEKCRRMAAQESCPDAREYYEALQRDYMKLAAKALPVKPNIMAAPKVVVRLINSREPARISIAPKNIS